MVKAEAFEGHNYVKSMYQVIFFWLGQYTYIYTSTVLPVNLLKVTKY